MTKTIEQIKAELAVLANQRAHLKAMDKLQNEGGEGYSAYDDRHVNRTQRICPRTRAFRDRMDRK